MYRCGVLMLTALVAGCNPPAAGPKIQKLADHVSELEAELAVLPRVPGEENAEKAYTLYEQVIRADNVLSKYKRMGGGFGKADFARMEELRPRINVMRKEAGRVVVAIVGNTAAYRLKEIDDRNPRDGPDVLKHAP